MTSINCVVCTHKDMDGFCCGAILLKKFPRAKICFSTSNTLHKALYRIRHFLKLGEEGNEVKNQLIICDISLNGKLFNQVNQALRYIRVKQKLPLDLTWIDHHQWPSEKDLIGDFEKIIDPSQKTAAILVQEWVGIESCSEFVKLAEGTATIDDIIYWKNVIRNVSKHEVSDEVAGSVMRAFSKLRPNDLTDQFNVVLKELTEEEVDNVKVQVTQGGRKFALLDLESIPHDIYLYKEVFKVAKHHGCDFVCVLFSNGELSCYNTNDISFGFLKDHGAVGHLEKGAVHVPIPYTKAGVYGFKRLLTVDEFVNLLKSKL